mgnify:CR=1 FL=1
MESEDQIGNPCIPRQGHTRKVAFWLKFEMETTVKVTVYLSSALAPAVSSILRTSSASLLEIPSLTNVVFPVPGGPLIAIAVSYTHLTLPTNREV